MYGRIPSASLSLWGRACLVSAVLGLPLFAGCTSSEDTEPFVPAVEGATQPKGEGALISEEDACERLLEAARAAYKRLGCDAPKYPECPGFLRPGGSSGCYTYYEDSVATCEQAYEDATSCRGLSPCLAVAERDDALPTCEQVDLGAGGAGSVAGASSGGSSSGAGPLPAGGAGAGGAEAVAGQAAGGAAGAAP
jgi:hypothetical protein